MELHNPFGMRKQDMTKLGIDEMGDFKSISFPIVDKSFPFHLVILLLTFSFKENKAILFLPISGGRPRYFPGVGDSLIPIMLLIWDILTHLDCLWGIISDFVRFGSWPEALVKLVKIFFISLASSRVALLNRRRSSAKRRCVMGGFVFLILMP